jgi:hypothetical protein
MTLLARRAAAEKVAMVSAQVVADNKALAPLRSKQPRERHRLTEPMASQPHYLLSHSAASACSCAGHGGD